MARKKGLFKRILRGVLIGAGSILSLLCPPVGGAVVTAGMSIGTGMVVAGGLIDVPEQEKKFSLDSVSGKITLWLEKIGLTGGVSVDTPAGRQPAFTLTGVLLIVGVLSAVYFFFFSKRRR